MTRYKLTIKALAGVICGFVTTTKESQAPLTTNWLDKVIWERTFGNDAPMPKTSRNSFAGLYQLAHKPALQTD